MIFGKQRESVIVSF